MKKAFTLIELLVVVLIIGILAAVAVPQYQRTVLRAKVPEAKTMLKAFATAADAYDMENGSSPTSYWGITDNLSIQVPESDFW